jgi:hypothetical protein
VIREAFPDTRSTLLFLIDTVSPVWCPGQNKRIALTPEIDCDQTEMSLPPVTSAVFLITNFGKRGRLGARSEMPLLPLRGKT